MHQFAFSVDRLLLVRTHCKPQTAHSWIIHGLSDPYPKKKKKKNDKSYLKTAGVAGFTQFLKVWVLNDFWWLCNACIG